MKRRPQDSKGAPWAFYIETYGCKVNQYESQALREAWENRGGVEHDRPEDADILCVNSCAVTARGERDARNAVFRLRRAAPKAKLILTGCAAQFFAAHKPRRGAPASIPDICCPQKHKASLLLRDPRELTQDMPGTPLDDWRITSFKRARPVVKVQNGCDHCCTFCVVPFTRGAPVSRSREDVLAECVRLFEAGHAEIMLSGINLRLYGKNAPTVGDFWDLLVFLDKNLAPEFAGRARLRISSLDPAQLGTRGLDLLASCRMACPHLHLSLQHASSAVLRRMGRGHYTAQDAADAVRKLARIWPTMGLGADILVGFPGETEADLDELLDFVREVPFSYAHVFPWSSRPGTPAAGFDGQMPVAARKARAVRIREAVAGKRAIFLQKQLGLGHMLVAADNPASSVLKGVNEFYAPCVFRDEPTPTASLMPARPVGLKGEAVLVEYFP
ncbi:MAG: MiaB/RimO family radical SAM methylthiotransferase [Desulfovibrio sp.]|jgi:MiaB/RimO family radical SAM methylthiotransferase|nr:MiaB/RimO family radical SAM methylthiotransferase [Desulfovibrio sp.]